MLLCLNYPVSTQSVSLSVSEVRQHVMCLHRLSKASGLHISFTLGSSILPVSRLFWLSLTTEG